MKCIYNQSKRGLPSDVRTMALKVAKEMLALQVDAVVSRAWNEMLVAMELHWSTRKLVEWHGEFIRCVAKYFGLLP